MTSKTTKQKIAALPVVGPAAMAGYRLRLASSYFTTPIRRAGAWSVTANEFTNLTYDLEDANKRYLAAMLADITGVTSAEVQGYFAELESDTELVSHIRQTTEAHDLGRFAESAVWFGRRIGWYALVRITKPKVVVETGVDKGLGSCALTAALRRNSAEGHSGHYWGTDIDPDAGWLLGGPWADYGTILYGDSIESLRAFDQPIDLFINDSDHSAEYEAREYETVADKLADGGLILGDNARITDKLERFAATTERSFLFFAEKPKDHWYPGAGIGVAFERGAFDRGASERGASERGASDPAGTDHTASEPRP